MQRTLRGCNDVYSLFEIIVSALWLYIRFIVNAKLTILLVKSGMQYKVKALIYNFLSCLIVLFYRKFAYGYLVETSVKIMKPLIPGKHTNLKMYIENEDIREIFQADYPRYRHAYNISVKSCMHKLHMHWFDMHDYGIGTMIHAVSKLSLRQILISISIKIASWLVETTIIIYLNGYE